MDYQRLIEDIKARTDIVDLISDYVDLRKTGANYKALCPFHSEKTPSFTVSPEKQIFHCFGCSAGGDIIGFIMKQDGIGFVEAVHSLAEKAGIKIKKDLHHNKESLQKREALLQIQKEALFFFVNNLKVSKIALDYLKNRGLSSQIIEVFSIGYSLDSRDELYRYLKSKGYSDEDILDSGVSKSGERGFYDIFRGRIIFPIFNIQSIPIAFGGRVINEALPKYLNSPETPIFKKGKNFYGINLAKDTITKQGYVIVVEGYLDVIMCYQYGFKNVIAPLGTSLTEDHVRIIKRYTKNVLLIFDSDNAGISAARRSLDIIFRNGLIAKVVLLPAGSDPDSFLKDHEAEEFKKILINAHDYINFMLTTGSNNAETLKEIYGTLSKISEPILKSKLLSEFADKASLSETILREEIKKFKRGKATLSNKHNDMRIKSAEDILLGIYISFPDMTEIIKETLDVNDIENPLIKKVFYTLLKQNGGVSIANLSSICNKDEISYISGLIIEPLIDKENIEENIRDCIKSIKRKSITKNLNILEEKIRHAESLSDEEELRNLLIEKQKILQLIRKY